MSMRFAYTKANPLANELSKNEFSRLYVDEKRTIVQIAAQYGVSQDAVFRLRRSYGIAARRNQRNQTSGVGQRGSLERACSPEEMKHFYQGLSLSMEEIGRRFGVTRKAVHRYFKRHDIHARTNGEARRIAVKRGKLAQITHSIVSEYFRQWSPAMAWTLGVLFVRGLVTEENKNGRKLLTLIGKEPGLIKLVRGNMGSSHSIRQEKTGAAYDAITHRYEVANVVLVEDLIKHGVVQRRERRKLAMSVPPEYVSSFVRGVFEGGGEVTRLDLGGAGGFSGKESPVILIRHLSETFLNQIRDMLAGSEIQTAGFVMVERNKAVRSLEYYDDHCQKLLSFIYPNAPDLCHWPAKRRETEKIIRGSGSHINKLAATTSPRPSSIRVVFEPLVAAR